MIRKHKIVFLLAAFVTGFQVAHAEDCVAIDALTSASTRFKTLTGSQYCATSAKIVWQDRYSNGDRKIEWGTSTSYGNTIALSGTTGTATLSSLKPNTKYYWRVNRSYEGKNPLTPASTFTTTSATAVNQKLDIANQLQFFVGNTPLTIPFNNQKSLTVSLFSTNGRLLMKQNLAVQGMALKSVSLDHQMPGIYLCTVKSDLGSVSEFTVLKK